MKIEKIPEIWSSDPTVKKFLDKIHELIDQTNENTEILTKTIKTIETLHNRYSAYFSQIAETLK